MWRGFRPGMPVWVQAINCFPNLSMGLLQLLTHRRNWRKYFNPSGINCYSPFVLTGTPRRRMECSRSGFRDWPSRILTWICSARKSICCSHTEIQGARWVGCAIRHIRCFRLRSDLVRRSSDPLSSLTDLPSMGSFKISGNSSIDMELYFVFTPTLIFRFFGNRTAR